MSENKESNIDPIQEMIDIVTSEQYNVYPILKPGSWEAIQQGVLKQTLLGDPKNPEVAIGFAYDLPDRFIFLYHQVLEKVDGNKILSEAYKNLDDFKVKLEYYEIESDNPRSNKMLLGSGFDYSSEKILSEAHLLKAHEMLEADEILVSIPRRTCMTIAPRFSDVDVINAFSHLHLNIWGDDSFGSPPITNKIFVVENGEIKGTLPSPDEKKLDAFQFTYEDKSED